MARMINLANFQQFAAINVLSDPGAIGGPIQIPNAAKFMIVWTLGNGKTARNILGMSVPSNWSATSSFAESARVALVAGTQWTGLATHLATGTALARVELLDIRPGSLGQVAQSTGAATPGTSSGTMLPNEVAAALTIRTSVRGPGGRGRFYIPGFATTALGAGDVINGAVVTALTAWSGNVNNAITAAGGSWALLLPARAAYTGSTGTQHPARAAGTLPMQAVVVRDNHWDSQRRRGLK